VTEEIFRYFPLLSDIQKEKLSMLNQIYTRWNNMINVISRKDMDNFLIRHVLHSMSIAKVISFLPGTRIIDVGTGGGFPGIPLAIIFPDSKFTLLDSTGKKIKVVSSVVEELELNNVLPLCKRIETEINRYHFVVSRAVTEFPGFVKMTSKNIERGGYNSLENGIIYLRGGELSYEIELYGNRLKVWNIDDFFDDPFFKTKKVVYLRV
jgi:16S rRNA (guanine527-N7)-methyltransferase